LYIVSGKANEVFYVESKFKPERATLMGQAETSDKPFPHVPVFDLKRRRE